MDMCWIFYLYDVFIVFILAASGIILNKAGINEGGDFSRNC